MYLAFHLIAKKTLEKNKRVEVEHISRCRSAQNGVRRVDLIIQSI
jgi:hypothetical protein